MNDTLYIVVAILEIGILEYIIRQVDGDRLNNLDPPTVRWARRISFTAGELFLCFSMYAIGWLWQPTLIDVGLILAGVLILSVNVISLHGRKPPTHGHRLHTTSFGRTSSIFARLTSHLNRHGR